MSGHSRLRHRLLSVLAVVLGLVVVQVLSLGTNQLVRIVGWLPHGDPAAALIYRSVVVVLGGYLAARVAPSHPMAHALVLGVVEAVIFAVAAAVLLPLQFFGPGWYYFGLAVAALPCAWLGGRLHARLQT
ncbi:hypothetical protein LV476_07935 [Guyparkeria hydrothermalis]|uniref:hypothetical protein n=1 Tax=Guyparkeria hydrothermalis TaxID=923 RepID=UPI0020206070|nr:hypothetical protein [Guyparkeria hydrothermalis]MCL7744864.1 hypothetical protein [Guyparkeria hydrothermalis]